MEQAVSLKGKQTGFCQYSTNRQDESEKEKLKYFDLENYTNN